MSGAERLRAAADRLDRLANDAVLTPWRVKPHAEVDEMPYVVGFGRDTAMGVTVARDVVNADYIVTMHPGVGKALADLLRVLSWFPSQSDPTDLTAAQVVADEILGTLA